MADNSIGMYLLYAANVMGKKCNFFWQMVPFWEKWWAIIQSGKRTGNCTQTDNRNYLMKGLVTARMVLMNHEGWTMMKDFRFFLSLSDNREQLIFIQVHIYKTGIQKCLCIAIDTRHWWSHTQLLTVFSIALALVSDFILQNSRHNTHSWWSKCTFFKTNFFQMLGYDTHKPKIINCSLNHRNLPQWEACQCVAQSRLCDYVNVWSHVSLVIFPTALRLNQLVEAEADRLLTDKQEQAVVTLVRRRWCGMQTLYLLIQCRASCPRWAIFGL